MNRTTQLACIRPCWRPWCSCNPITTVSFIYLVGVCAIVTSSALYHHLSIYLIYRLGLHKKHCLLNKNCTSHSGSEQLISQKKKRKKKKKLISGTSLWLTSFLWVWSLLSSRWRYRGCDMPMLLYLYQPLGMTLHLCYFTRQYFVVKTVKFQCTNCF